MKVKTEQDRITQLRRLYTKINERLRTQKPGSRYAELGATHFKISRILSRQYGVNRGL